MSSRYGKIKLNFLQKMVSFVCLTTIYLHIQFESTSQQAITLLFDMADLHVSDFPRGGGGGGRESLANSNAEQPAQGNG